MAKYDFLSYTAAHADIHLGQKLRASLAPPVILWKHGDLQRSIEGKVEDVEDKVLTRHSSLKLCSESMNQLQLSLHVPDWGLWA